MPSLIFSLLLRLSLAAMLMQLLACSHQASQDDWDPNDYTVRSGDTLYSIAWRFEIDPNKLAQWNQLVSPDLIHPGQRLHTRAPRYDQPYSQQYAPQNDQSGLQVPGFRPQVAAIAPESQRTSPTPIEKPEPQRVARVTTYRVVPGDTIYSLARKRAMSVDEFASMNGLKKPYTIYPGQLLRLDKHGAVATTQEPNSTPSATTKHTPGVTPQTTTVSQALPQKLPSGPIKWRWPMQGKLLATFNKRKNNAKGIDIAGNKGKSVQAAAAGKVVYSGNGLISYGNLIIIKHNDAFLSAYAYNKKLLVKEGQFIKSGQKIAEIGQFDNEKPRLHFEIRKKGKPVDPLRYLPSS